MTLLSITGLSASPSTRSRSGALLQLALARLELHARQVQVIALRELPAAALLGADAQHPAIRQAVEAVDRAGLVVIGTPIYKAAYSGLLKVFLDLLPPEALRGKTVLPLATGGSPAHLLALDYALRPVLSALGARHILDSVYAVDSQLAPHDSGAYLPSPDLLERLDRALEPLRVQHPQRTGLETV